MKEPQRMWAVYEDRDKPYTIGTTEEEAFHAALTSFYYGEYKPDLYEQLVKEMKAEGYTCREVEVKEVEG